MYIVTDGTQAHNMSNDDAIPALGYENKEGTNEPTNVTKLVNFLLSLPKGEDFSKYKFNIASSGAITVEDEGRWEVECRVSMADYKTRFIIFNTKGRTVGITIKDRVMLECYNCLNNYVVLMCLYEDIQKLVGDKFLPSDYRTHKDEVLTNLTKQGFVDESKTPYEVNAVVALVGHYHLEENTGKEEARAKLVSHFNDENYVNALLTDPLKCWNGETPGPGHTGQRVWEAVSVFKWTSMLLDENLAESPFPDGHLERWNIVETSKFVGDTINGL
jgi:hypothetical protein